MGMYKLTCCDLTKANKLHHKYKEIGYLTKHCIMSLHESTNMHTKYIEHSSKRYFIYENEMYIAHERSNKTSKFFVNYFY